MLHRGYRWRHRSAQAIYFEYEGWTDRFLVVDTGDWLFGRQVLISPLSLRTKDYDPKRLFTSLTKAKVKDSPDVNFAPPVSRQHEVAFSRYYG